MHEDAKGAGLAVGCLASWRCAGLEVVLMLGMGWRLEAVPSRIRVHSRLRGSKFPRGLNRFFKFVVLKERSESEILFKCA